MPKFRFDSERSGLTLEMSQEDSFIDFSATAIFIGYAGYFLYTMINRDLNARVNPCDRDNSFAFKDTKDNKDNKNDDKDDAYLKENGWTKV
jgi:hypothetical protein